MLRILFNEPRRKEEGLLGEAMEAIAFYFNSLDPIEDDSPKQGNRRHIRYLQVWINGFIRALDELEQSAYSAQRFAERVESNVVEKMDIEERDDYHRYLYFYKNGFLRVFSILDKLGYFFNELLQLETESFKSKFSYFTVLRQMHEKNVESELEKQLFRIKNDYQDSITVLRNQRNMETHLINTEIMDDLEQAKKTSSGYTPVEDVRENIRHLQRGYEMVCKTLSATFNYLHDKQPASVEEEAVERTADTAVQQAQASDSGSTDGVAPNGNRNGSKGKMRSGSKAPGGRGGGSSRSKKSPSGAAETGNVRADAFKQGKTSKSTRMRRQPEQAGK